MEDSLYYLMIAVSLVFIALGGLPNLSRSAKLVMASGGAVAAGIAAILALMVVVD